MNGFVPSRDEVLALAKGPLANPLRINLPLGKRPAPRAASEKRELQPGDLTTEQLRERRDRDRSGKLGQLLDYYAKTDVPFERVAEHLKLPLNRVVDCRKERGRAQ